MSFPTENTGELKIQTILQAINSNNLTLADSLLAQLLPQHFNNEKILCLAADVKIKLGQIKEALELICKAINIATNFDHYISFAVNQLNAKNYDITIQILSAVIAKNPNCYNSFNVLGVAHKNKAMFPEAMHYFLAAIKINDREIMAWTNMGNAYMAWQKYEQAFEAFSQAIKRDPNHIESHRMLAASCIASNQNPQAYAILEKLLKIAPNNTLVITDLCAAYYNNREYDKALEVIEHGAKVAPDDLGILRTKAMVLRQLGFAQESATMCNQILMKYPQDIETILALANAYYYSLGDVDKAYEYYEMAYALNPNHIPLLQKLCNFLLTIRGKKGTEGGNLDRAYELSCKMLALTHLPISISESAQPSFLKTLDYENYSKLGSSNEMIKYWGEQFNSPPLTYQMSRVKTLEDRLNLINAHRCWGEKIEDNAKSKPIKHKVRQRLNNKIRIGILSSDLRNHPVGYFTWPIIEHLDRSKFEIYCYNAYPYEVDLIQHNVRQRVDSFKSFLEETPHDVAQSTADDSLDILFELAGNSLFNRIESCAYKPAPVQVSWLGYPHSIGLPSTLDYIMVDPYINPKNPDLLIEKPFIMPQTWVSIDKIGFYDVPITNIIPEEKNNFITFGTLNMPHKLTPETFALWGYIMNMVPNSRFLYSRPETDSLTLRKNFLNYMQEYGIEAERISFVATRSNHLDIYNRIDIALDTFPHTGGTTTCETLWMGVPAVTLVGESFYERLSYSNLSNAGLPDLCAFSLKEYKDITLKLVDDKERRKHLRQNLRQQILQNPLGQPRLFAKSFGDTVIKTLG